MTKVIDDKMDVGMDVGRLLDRFLVDLGTILGSKLAPNWHQNKKKRVPKRCQKMNANKHEKGTKKTGYERLQRTRTSQARTTKK